MFDTIRALFRKDLAKITSSFSKIYDDLEALKVRLATAIDRHSITIAAETAKRQAALFESEAAERVKNNIQQLLGK